jgi:hypothetical protein
VSARLRPLVVIRVAGMVAHHAVELGAGVGLVFQPELGLPGAAALWAAVVAAELLVLGPYRSGAERLRAAAAGTTLAGVGVHYMLWPWEVRGGLPRLCQAEGLSSAQLPWYEAVLLAWAAGAVGSLAVDVGGGRRRWALVGVVAAPLLARSARHHFAWVTDQARTRPRWWNRAVRAGRG